MNKLNQKIPEGWSVKKGKDISSLITKGASPKWQGFEYCDSGTLFVTSENVRDGFLDISNPKFLPNAFSEKQKRSKLKNGDILINIVGASIGRSCLYNKDIPANINQAVCLFRCNSAAHNLYTLLYLSLPKTIRTLLETQTESARPNLSLSDISLLNFLLPPLPEQEKIAEILGVWDEAIEKLSGLIEQKKLLKKGMMQKLLTGKTRLSGFTQPWKEVKLGDIMHEHLQTSSGNEVVCSVSVHKGVVDQIEHLGRSFSAANTSNYNLVHYGDVIYTKSPTGDFPYGIFKQSQQKNDVIVSPLYGVFTPSSYALGYILDAYFSYPINMNNYLRPIIQKGAKNTINITNKTFLSRSLFLPTDISEQQAIADVLSTADDEINLLNQKLEALKEQKKGLMQRLLTGQIRVKVN